MKHISSRDNPQFKFLLRLSRGKVEHEVLLEGVHLCQEWLRRGGMPVLALFDAERVQSHTELANLAAALDPTLCLTVDSTLLRRLSDVEAPQGVYFVVPKPVESLPARIVRTCLWLDRVQDPGNVGTLLRTAAAAGLEHIYLSPGCAGVYSQKVLRSAQGAHFSLRLFEQADLAALCQRLDIPLLVTSLGQAESLYASPLPTDCVWLFGNEGQGVDADLLKRADRRVYIPQEARVESLNVAAAAAICLFEQRRQKLSTYSG